ncbi:Hypothetical protein NGAL_HAMBI2605_59380 [Neorhizobium galegae bv. orientalis]|nr:Hypothetical protein NGAL_HAMBI2605_59380 [Neorhizobium galegae bv. orientalis]
MRVTWQDIDSWREARDMDKSELARAVGISESTIYRGLQRNSRPLASTRREIRKIFPEKFDEQGEVRSDG